MFIVLGLGCISSLNFLWKFWKEELKERSLISWDEVSFLFFGSISFLIAYTFEGGFSSLFISSFFSVSIAWFMS